MRPDIQAKLQRIKKVSVIFRAICTVLLALIMLVGLGCVTVVVSGRGTVSYDNDILRTTDLALGYRLILGVLTAVSLGVLFKCFYHLRRLFGNYSRGEIFTRESVGQLRQFGVACLLWGFMNILWFVSLVLLAHPAKTLERRADSFVIGAIIIVIAWFMDMAVDLREENELTI